MLLPAVILYFLWSSGVCLGAPLELGGLSSSLIPSACTGGKNSSGTECLKTALAGLVPLLSLPTKVPILPGLSLVSEGFEAGAPPQGPQQLEAYLARGIRLFLGSLSLRVRVQDQQDVAEAIGNFSRALSGDDEEEEEGRRRRVSRTSLTNGLMMGGTALALTMSALSFLAGKALFMSLMSMGLVLFNRSQAAGGGGGGGGKTKAYEVVHVVPHEKEYGKADDTRYNYLHGDLHR